MKGLSHEEQAVHMVIADILDGTHLNVLDSLRVLASLQFRYADCLSKKGLSSRSEALILAAEVTAQVWTELEELQKPAEIKRAIAADILANDLVTRTLGLPK